MQVEVDPTVSGLIKGRKSFPQKTDRDKIATSQQNATKDIKPNGCKKINSQKQSDINPQSTSIDETTDNLTNSCFIQVFSEKTMKRSKFNRSHR